MATLNKLKSQGFKLGRFFNNLAKKHPVTDNLIKISGVTFIATLAVPALMPVAMAVSATAGISLCFASGKALANWVMKPKPNSAS